MQTGSDGHRAMKIHLDYKKKHQQHGSCTPEIQVITVPLAKIVDKEKVTVIDNASKIVFLRNLEHYWYYFLCSNR